MGRGMRQWLEASGKYARLDRIMNRSEAHNRADNISDFPTLAHVPGVEPDKNSRYRTKIMHMGDGKRRAIQKPRLLFASPRRQAQIIHLGGGRVLFQ